MCVCVCVGVDYDLTQLSGSDDNYISSIEDSVKQDTHKHKHETTHTEPRKLLTEKQEVLFQTWLSNYRKRWQHYWTFIGDNTYKDFLQIVPCTKEDLRKIDGFGEKKINDYGDEVLATVYAFLDTHELLDKVLMYIYIYIYTFTFTYIHIYTHLHTFTYIYIHTHVYTHKHMHYNTPTHMHTL